MKRILISVVLAALVAGGISFAAARWMKPKVQPIHETEWLRQQLALTPEQTTAIAQLEKQFREALQRDCAAHCAARYELGQSLADPDAAKQCVEQMCAAQTSAERVTLDHILKVRAALTPQQQQRYAALMEHQLSGPCPMGVHAR